MAGRLQTLTLAAHFGIAALIVAAASVLTALHDLDAATFGTILGAAIGLVGGSAAALGAVGSAVNGKAVVDPVMLRTAIEQLGKSSPAPQTIGGQDG